MTTIIMIACCYVGALGPKAGLILVCAVRLCIIEEKEGLEGLCDLETSESLGLGPSDALSVGLAISAPSAPAEPCLAGGGAPSPLGGGAG